MTNILEIIKREMQQKHLSSTELSRKMGLHQTTVHGMLTRDSIKVERLAELCNIMQYNFFRELAEQFPYEQPEFNEVFKQKEAALTEEIKTLKIKVEVLNEVIEKIG